jgi:hypothetical protein
MATRPATHRERMLREFGIIRRRRQYPSSTLRAVLSFISRARTFRYRCAIVRIVALVRALQKPRTTGEQQEHPRESTEERAHGGGVVKSGLAVHATRIDDWKHLPLYSHRYRDSPIVYPYSPWLAGHVFITAGTKTHASPSGDPLTFLNSRSRKGVRRHEPKPRLRRPIGERPPKKELARCAASSSSRRQKSD